MTLYAEVLRQPEADLFACACLGCLTGGRSSLIAHVLVSTNDLLSTES